MSLLLKTVESPGVLERERVVLKATTDVDIGEYALLRCEMDAGGLPYSGPIEHAFWFVDKKIKAGDLVVLYTKEGNKSEKAINEGATSYFFYWGLETPLWRGAVGPILIKTDTWQRIRPAAPEPG